MHFTAASRTWSTSRPHTGLNCEQFRPTFIWHNFGKNLCLLIAAVGFIFWLLDSPKYIKKNPYKSHNALTKGFRCRLQFSVLSIIVLLWIFHGFSPLTSRVAICHRGFTRCKKHNGSFRSKGNNEQCSSHTGSSRRSDWGRYLYWCRVFIITLPLYQLQIDTAINTEYMLIIFTQSSSHDCMFYWCCWNNVILYICFTMWSNIIECLLGESI